MLLLWKELPRGAFKDILVAGCLVRVKEGVEHFSTLAQAIQDTALVASRASNQSIVSWGP